MRKSDFREFVKEMFIDLIENDQEVRDIVMEFVQKNGSVISESVQKEPVDPDLYDKLMLIASGQEKKFIYEGKVVKSPNYGNGFKSGKNIKEWADKAYSKIGGKWGVKSGNSIGDSTGIRGDTLSFLGAMGAGGDGGNLKNIGSAGNDKIIRESIVNSGRGAMMGLDENGQFDPSRSIDISSLLVDTAKTTLQNFPSSHEMGTASATGAGQEAFRGAPEEVFKESAGNWAALAFQGMDVGK